MLRGRANRVDHEPRVVRERVEITDCARQVLRRDAGKCLKGLLAAENSTAAEITHSAQYVVHFRANRELQRAQLVPLRPGKMNANGCAR